jgi:hypothetical protein
MSPARARRRRRRAQVGFVVTPGEIQNRIAAIDAAIQALNSDVWASKAPRVNALWRQEWNAFVRRWGVERDSYATWDSRLFATRVMPRLDDFEASYRRWAREFEQRSGAPPTVPLARRSESLFDGSETLWWAVGAAVLLYAWQKGGR